MDQEPTTEKSAAVQPDAPEVVGWEAVEAPDDRPGGRGRGALVAVAALAVLLVAALAVPLLLDDSDSTTSALRPLGITGTEFATEAMSADAAMSMPAMATTYELAGPLPDLGSTGPVWQLTAPPLDVAAVGAIADTLGVTGTPRAAGDGFVVEGDDGAVYVYRGSGGWSVSMSANTSFGSGCAMTGSVGTASSSGVVEGSSGSGVMIEEISPGVTITAVANPDAPVSSDAMTTDVVEEPDVACVESMPEAPANLPTPEAAAQQAKELVASLGVDGELQAEANDSGGGMTTMACAPPEPTTMPIDADCKPPPAVVYSRSITVRPQVDGVAVDGFEWYVEIGDGGAVTSVNGTLTELELVGDYPLQTTQQAYDAMVAGTSGFGTGMIEPALGAPGVIEDDFGTTEYTATTFPPSTTVVDEPTLVGPTPDDVLPTDPAATPPPVAEELPVLVDPMPIEPPIELQPRVVIVSGATLVRQVAYGVDASGGDASYVVPAYRFEGVERPYGFEPIPWSSTVIAVTPELLGMPSEDPVPEPVPMPDTTIVTDTTVKGSTEPPCAPQADGSEICMEPTPAPAPVPGGPGPDSTIVCVTDPCGDDDTVSSPETTVPVGGEPPVTTVPTE